jgi:hypothetical protein
MPDPIHGEPFDLSQIDDPAVRRALKTLHTQMTASLYRQQLEIDALLELMLEKHIGSIGEFKRQLVRLQQDRSRSQRIHTAIAAAQAQPGMTSGMNRGIH